MHTSMEQRVLRQKETGKLATRCMLVYTMRETECRLIPLSQLQQALPNTPVVSAPHGDERHS